ncbi:MAG: hypothetical protein LBL61_04725 [Elusimicrobiota bacterium]|nr:hypothetical protein [Elusimicrobiota bacterium]
MKLKRLILFVLGLFILSVFSHAADDYKEIPDHLTIAKSGGGPICRFKSATPEMTLPGIENGIESTEIKYPVGNYAGRDVDFYDLFKIALTSKDPYEKARNTAFAARCAKFSGHSAETYYSSDNYWPLHLAVVYEHEDLVNYFVGTLKWKVDAYSSMTGSRTALILTAAKAKEKMTKNLVGFGADVDYRDDYLKTAAVYAKEGMKDPTTPATKKQIYERIHNYLKPLMTADADVIDQLIQKAATRALKYELTDKERLAENIGKIFGNPIFMDGWKLFGFGKGKYGLG